MASSHQRIIEELQEHTAELLAGEREATQAVGVPLDRTQALGVENKELNFLLASLDTQQTILDSDLKSLSCSHDKERQLNLIHSDEREGKNTDLGSRIGRR